MLAVVSRAIVYAMPQCLSSSFSVTYRNVPAEIIPASPKVAIPKSRFSVGDTANPTLAIMPKTNPYITPGIISLKPKYLVKKYAGSPRITKTATIATKKITAAKASAPIASFLSENSSGISAIQIAPENEPKKIPMTSRQSLFILYPSASPARSLSVCLLFGHHTAVVPRRNSFLYSHGTTLNDCQYPMTAKAVHIKIRSDGPVARF